MPINAIRSFLRLEAAGGILLLGATALALIMANVPGVDRVYADMLAMPFELRLGPLELKKTFHLLVNDGMMTIFFLLVGLEIKREMMEGELASLGQIMLPGIAAAGGVALPAAIFAWMNWQNPDSLRGWAIPAATDIAFSLAVLGVFGRRVPVSLKVFLMALAVLDDLAAIVIIALFYTDHLSVSALAVAVSGLAVLWILNFKHVASLTAYLLVGAIIWLGVLKSGVHATLAGVALGLAIPLRVQHASGESLLRYLEHALHPWVAYLILPIFAFSNAGVSFAGVSWATLTGPIALGIAAGLIVGKTVGVFTAATLTIKLKLAPLPTGASWAGLFGVAALCGIGFTMSLFIGSLAYQGHPDEFGVATRVGVLGGSTISALLGMAILSAVLPDQPPSGRNGDS